MLKRMLLMFSCVSLLVAVTLVGVAPRANVARAQDQNSFRAPTALQLVTVLSGLSNTVFVTHAHDGTNRLFVIEKVGRIRVAQPGAATTTVFLDITTRVLATGNEQGLLGLAFHPQYPINGRFFVYYTRTGDGALKVAEYHVSANDPNVADTTEIAFNGIFPIPHPGQTNHNGGMMAFGTDGYLYIGTGDGGSSNDPNNNAQNINSLLGKMLRIDVDTPNGAVVYSSPPSNPFSGSIAGADEIYAYGLRNPWRWSFDRATGQLVCGDVGQGAREEIDIITNGGNYGWRVMEGMICNPAFNGGVCTPPSGHILPIFDYSHSTSPGGGTRCSITGGYVYRGFRSTVPASAYVYADYCTGEIWQLQSGTNTPLMDTELNISSFGEDEAGEIYVVGQNGTINRLAQSPAPPTCAYSLNTSGRLYPLQGADSSLTLTTASDCGWLAAANVSWISLTQTSGAGTGAVSFTIAPNMTGVPRTGLIHIGGQTYSVLQEGVPSADCSPSLMPLYQSFLASGGTGSFTVTVENRCAWQATASASWITITSGGMGTGNATLTYNVAANTTGKARIGSISFGKTTFTVKQKA